MKSYEGDFLMSQRNHPYEITVDMETAALAYSYWEQRGQTCGTPELDWYRAVDDMNRERTRQGFDLV
jgi:hypothetical protein